MYRYFTSDLNEDFYKVKIILKLVHKISDFIYFFIAISIGYLIKGCIGEKIFKFL